MNQIMVLKLKPTSVFLIWGILAFILLGVFFGKFYFQAKKQADTTYDFVIKDIKVTNKGNLVFFDGENWVAFTNFNVYKSKDIQNGDRLIKKKCSKYLYIYREKDNQENPYLTIKRDGIYPLSWFCH